MDAVHPSNLFFLPRLSVWASAPAWAGPVQQQPALYPVRSSRRPLLPLYSETGREPVGVWLQVGSSTQMFILLFLNKSQHLMKFDCIFSASTTWCTGYVCTQGWGTLAWCVALLSNTLGRGWRTMCSPTTESVRGTETVAETTQTRRTPSCGTRQWRCRENLRRSWSPATWEPRRNIRSSDFPDLTWTFHLQFNLE